MANNTPMISGRGQAVKAVSVTPNDLTDLSEPGAALYIGGAGNVKVNMASEGTAITFVGIPAGSFLPILVNRVYATDTTATSILAIY